MFKNINTSFYLVIKNITTNKLIIFMIIGFLLASIWYTVDAANWVKYDIEHWHITEKDMHVQFSNALQTTITLFLLCGSAISAIIFTNTYESNLLDGLISQKKPLLPFVISLISVISLLMLAITFIVVLLNFIIFGCIVNYWAWIKIPQNILLSMIFTLFLFVLSFSFCSFISATKFEKTTKVIILILCFILFFFFAWYLPFTGQHVFNLDSISDGFEVGTMSLVTSTVFTTAFYGILTPLSILLRLIPYTMFPSLWKDFYLLENHLTSTIIYVQMALIVAMSIAYTVIFPLLSVKLLGERYE